MVVIDGVDVWVALRFSYHYVTGVRIVKTKAITKYTLAILVGYV